MWTRVGGQLLPMWRKVVVRVSPLTEIWHNATRIIGDIDMITIATFAQRAGRVDRAVARADAARS